MENRYKKFPIAIRIVSFILIVTFLAQDIVWAHSEPFINKSARNNKLAIDSFFNRRGERVGAEGVFIEHLIERHPSIGQKISLDVISRVLELKDIKGWLINNNITYQILKNKGGDICEVRITIPHWGVLRYFDPALSSETEIAAGSAGNHVEKINEHLHKERISAEFVKEDVARSGKPDTHKAVHRKIVDAIRRVIARGRIRNRGMLGLIAIAAASAAALYTGNPMYMFTAFAMTKLRKRGSLHESRSESPDDLLSLSEQSDRTTEEEEREGIDWDMEILEALDAIFIQNPELFGQALEGEWLYSQIAKSIGNMSKIEFWARLKQALGDACAIETEEGKKEDEYFVAIFESGLRRKLNWRPPVSAEKSPGDREYNVSYIVGAGDCLVFRADFKIDIIHVSRGMIRLNVSRQKSDENESYSIIQCQGFIPIGYGISARFDARYRNKVRIILKTACGIVFRKKEGSQSEQGRNAPTASTRIERRKKPPAAEPDLDALEGLSSGRREIAITSSRARQIKYDFKRYYLGLANRIAEGEDYAAVWRSLPEKTVARINNYFGRDYDTKLRDVKVAVLLNLVNRTENARLTKVAADLEKGGDLDEVRLIAEAYGKIGCEMPDSLSDIVARVSNHIYRTAGFVNKYGPVLLQGVYCASEDEVDELLKTILLGKKDGAEDDRSVLIKTIEQYVKGPSNQSASRIDEHYDEYGQSSNALNRLRYICIDRLASALLDVEKISRDNGDLYDSLMGAFWNTDMGKDIISRANIRPYYVDFISENPDKSDGRGYTALVHEAGRIYKKIVAERKARSAKETHGPVLSFIPDASSFYNKLDDAEKIFFSEFISKSYPQYIDDLVVRNGLSALILGFERSGFTEYKARRVIALHLAKGDEVASEPSRELAAEVVEMCDALKNAWAARASAAAFVNDAANRLWPKDEIDALMIELRDMAQDLQYFSEVSSTVQGKSDLLKEILDSVHLKRPRAILDRVNLIRQDLDTELALFEGLRKKLNTALETAGQGAIIAQEMDLAVTKALYLRNIAADLFPEYHKPARTDLKALVFSVLNAHRQVERHAAVNYELGDENVMIDQPALTRALGKIIYNAGEAIDANAQQGEVHVNVRRPGDARDKIEIVISDTAGGMTAEALEKAFSGYSDKGDRLWAYRKGRGYGLPLAKKYIEERCGGAISIASEKGKGTVVTIRIPFIGAPEGTKEPQKTGGDTLREITNIVRKILPACADDRERQALCGRVADYYAAAEHPSEIMSSARDLSFTREKYPDTILLDAFRRNEHWRVKAVLADCIMNRENVPGEILGEILQTIPELSEYSRMVRGFALEYPVVSRPYPHVDQIEDQKLKRNALRKTISEIINESMNSWMPPEAAPQVLRAVYQRRHILRALLDDPRVTENLQFTHNAKRHCIYDEFEFPGIGHLPHERFSFHNFPVIQAEDHDGILAVMEKEGIKGATLVNFDMHPDFLDRRNTAPEGHWGTLADESGLVSAYDNIWVPSPEELKRSRAHILDKMNSAKGPVVISICYDYFSYSGNCPEDDCVFCRSAIADIEGIIKECKNKVKLVFLANSELWIARDQASYMPDFYMGDYISWLTDLIWQAMDGVDRAYDVRTGSQGLSNIQMPSEPKTLRDEFKDYFKETLSELTGSAFTCTQKNRGAENFVREVAECIDSLELLFPSRLFDSIDWNSPGELERLLKYCRDNAVPIFDDALYQIKNYHNPKGSAELAGVIAKYKSILTEDLLEKLRIYEKAQPAVASKTPPDDVALNGIRDRFGPNVRFATGRPAEDPKKNPSGTSRSISRNQTTKVESIHSAGILIHGIRYAVKQDDLYTPMRSVFTKGLLPNDEIDSDLWQYSRKFRPNVVPFAMVGREKDYYGTSVYYAAFGPSHSEWIHGNIAYILDPAYVRAHCADFTAVGKSFDPSYDESRYRDKNGQIYNGITTYKENMAVYPDEVWINSIPPEAISAIIVEEEYAAQIRDLIVREFPNRTLRIFSPKDILLFDIDGSKVESPAAGETGDNSKGSAPAAPVDVSCEVSDRVPWDAPQESLAAETISDALKAIIPESYAGKNAKYGDLERLARAHYALKEKDEKEILLAGDFAIQALNVLVEGKDSLSLPVDIANLTPILRDFETNAYDRTGVCKELCDFMSANPAINKENVGSLSVKLTAVNDLNERTELSLRHVRHESRHDIFMILQRLICACTQDVPEQEVSGLNIDKMFANGRSADPKQDYPVADYPVTLLELIGNRIAARKKIDPKERYEHDLPTMAVWEAVVWRRWLLRTIELETNSDFVRIMNSVEKVKKEYTMLVYICSYEILPIAEGSIDPTLCDLRKILRDAKANAVHELKCDLGERAKTIRLSDKVIRLDFKPSSGPHMIEVDSRLITEAFAMLIKNAIQVAAERLEDEPGLTLEDRPIKLLCSVERKDGGDIMFDFIEMNDNVGGIPDPEILKEAVPGSGRQRITGINVSRKKKDTGFGLAYVWHIIRMHGGSFWIENIGGQPGKGVHISIRIPSRSDGSAKSPAEAAEQPQRPRGVGAAFYSDAAFSGYMEVLGEYVKMTPAEVVRREGMIFGKATAGILKVIGIKFMAGIKRKKIAYNKKPLSEGSRKTFEGIGEKVEALTGKVQETRQRLQDLQARAKIVNDGLADLLGYIDFTITGHMNDALSSLRLICRGCLQDETELSQQGAQNMEIAIAKMTSVAQSLIGMEKVFLDEKRESMYLEYVDRNKQDFPIYIETFSNKGETVDGSKGAAPAPAAPERMGVRRDGGEVGLWQWWDLARTETPEELVKRITTAGALNDRDIPSLVSVALSSGTVRAEFERLLDAARQANAIDWFVSPGAASDPEPAVELAAQEGDKTKLSKKPIFGEQVFPDEFLFADIAEKNELIAREQLTSKGLAECSMMPADDTLFVYRGMRVDMAGLRDMLINGVESKWNGAVILNEDEDTRTLFTDDPAEAVGFALEPSPAKRPVKEKFMSVVVMIDKPRNSQWNGKRLEYEFYGSIPKDWILGVYLFNKRKMKFERYDQKVLSDFISQAKTGDDPKGAAPAHTLPAAEPANGASQSDTPLVVESGAADAIGLIDKLFKDVRVPGDSRVILSERLFIADDGDRTELDGVRLALKPLLDNGAISILSPEDIRRRATNGNVSKDKLTAVLSAEEFNDTVIWKDSDKETRLKASVLVLGDKLTGSNYLYLQGVIGLARAIMANNRQAVSRYYSILSGMAIDESVLKLLDDGRENNIAFAIKAILRFKDRGRVDPNDIIRMERLLIEA